MSQPDLMFMDSGNQFMVATNAARDRVVIQPIGGTISRADALNLAAWIVALMDPEQKDFGRLLKAITQT